MKQTKPNHNVGQQATIQNPTQKSSTIQAKQRPVQRRFKAPMQTRQCPVNKSNPKPRTIDPFYIKPNTEEAPIQQKPNNTGLPDGLKSGIEHLSGMDISDVKACYNTDKPMQFQAFTPQQDLNQYGVDLSEYQEQPNSSFPASVGATATIQGKNIHYAPGEYTEKNRKHELGHAIDNAKNGTPKGDQIINGQLVDTTREKAADKIAETPLQRKEINHKKPLQARVVSKILQLTKKKKKKKTRKPKASRPVTFTWDDCVKQAGITAINLANRLGLTPKEIMDIVWANHNAGSSRFKTLFIQKNREKNIKAVKDKNKSIIDGIVKNFLDNSRNPQDWTHEQVEEAHQDIIQQSLRNTRQALYEEDINLITVLNQIYGEIVESRRGKRGATLGFTKDAAKSSTSLTPDQGIGHASHLLTGDKPLNVRDKKHINKGKNKNTEELTAERQSYIRQIKYPDMQEGETHAMGLGHDVVAHSYYEDKQEYDDYGSLTNNLERHYPDENARREVVGKVYNYLGLTYKANSLPNNKKQEEKEEKYDSKKKIIKKNPGRFIRQFATIQMVEKGRENEARGNRKELFLIEKALLHTVKQGFRAVYKKNHEKGGFAGKGGKKWFTQQYTKQDSDNKSMKVEEKNSHQTNTSSVNNNSRIAGVVYLESERQINQRSWNQGDIFAIEQGGTMAYYRWTVNHHVGTSFSKKDIVRYLIGG